MQIGHKSRFRISRARNHLLLACLTSAFLSSKTVNAQFTDPRSYDPSPIGTNALELSYSYARTDATVGSERIVAGAKIDLNVGSIDYTHYVGIANHLAWVETFIPVGSASGTINRTALNVTTEGAGDSTVLLATLLKGGPALTVPQFENYKPKTLIGLSLGITVPTGHYNPNFLLNLGTNRWAFKPEFAISTPFGPSQKWEIDFYANSYFYTSDKQYQGNQLFQQQVLPGFEGHLSYNFTDNLWASVDTRYSLHGTTSINNVSQQNPQTNLSLGSEINFALNDNNSLTLVYANALVYQNGPTYKGFSIRYEYSWGGSLGAKK